jgi:hypothetical protein
MSYRNRILQRLTKKDSVEKVALCVYTTYQTVALKGLDDMKFDIMHEVAEKFEVDITNILIAGSAQTGESFHKEILFNPKTSDLDLSIVDANLFETCLKEVYIKTSDYENLADFPRKENISLYQEYLINVARGFFRPDLMPNCKFKSEWFDFFRKLSSKYNSNFESINCGVYSSLFFFQMKQSNNIQIVKRQGAKS